ncbi:MAG: dihydroorotase [Cytophagaceae bacterium]|nr:dihydroorotase [Cytophagaceae bacterium]MBP6094250.1 dihydroorotase [Cytophagaceae bacterium]
MKKYLITNALIVNEGQIIQADVLISDERIERIAPWISDANAQVIDFNGNYLIPGMIDDQVHFRDPGLTYKADIFSESKAAVAGGITSFMDMPNTIPNTLNRALLEEKYQWAAKKSMANYSFFMGVTASNLDEAIRVDNESVCGITDDGLYLENQEILANNPEYLEKLFSRAETLVALHSEDDAIIRRNLSRFQQLYGDEIPIAFHPAIRTSEACETATRRVLDIQKKHNNRLHFFHISTGAEAKLFSPGPIAGKRVTAEACIHHLCFTDADYPNLGSKIMWNPSVKSETDRLELLKALQDGRIDMIATDHAPHSLEEKSGNYMQIKSGAPMVQHALLMLFELVDRGELALTTLVDKTSHRVADCYKMVDRGYIREGYFADLVEVAPSAPWEVKTQSLFYKCGWAPVVGRSFHHEIKRTFVSGILCFQAGKFLTEKTGKRLQYAKIR